METSSLIMPWNCISSMINPTLLLGANVSPPLINNGAPLIGVLSSNLLCPILIVLYFTPLFIKLSVSVAWNEVFNVLALKNALLGLSSSLIRELNGILLVKPPPPASLLNWFLVNSIKSALIIPLNLGFFWNLILLANVAPIPTPNNAAPATKLKMLNVLNLPLL